MARLLLDSNPDLPETHHITALGCFSKTEMIFFLRKKKEVDMIRGHPQPPEKIEIS